MRTLPMMFAAGMLVSMSAAAEIYKCTDASGKTRYGDQPCKGESSIFTPRTGPKVDENVEERNKKTQQLLRSYQEERAEEKQKSAKLKAKKEKRTKKCRIARNRYQHIISARRIYGIDQDGNQADYTDKERAEATASARADIKTWCHQ